MALLLQCVEKEAELMCIKNEHLRHLTCRWVARKGEEGLPERIQLQLSGHIDKLKDPVVVSFLLEYSIDCYNSLVPLHYIKDIY